MSGELNNDKDLETDEKEVNGKEKEERRSGRKKEREKQQIERMIGRGRKKE